MEAFLPAKEVDCVIAMAGDGQDRRQQQKKAESIRHCTSATNRSSNTTSTSMTLSLAAPVI